MACCCRRSQKDLTGLADAVPIVAAWQREAQRLQGVEVVVKASGWRARP
jgi:hypothetical protein